MNLQTLPTISQTFSTMPFNLSLLEQESALKHFKNLKFNQTPKPPIAETDEKSLSSIHSAESYHRKNSGKLLKKKTFIMA